MYFKKNHILICVCGLAVSSLNAQYSTDPAQVYSFVFNGQVYEIVKENRNWEDAAACAVARGGKLAEINSQEEQDALFTEIYNAGILAENTIAPDGGNGSYLWIGGNDSALEGNWVWNGNNDNDEEPFWIGTANGVPVNGSYTNWGNEPDNWAGQDGLGFAFTNWPLGMAGQWNDIWLSNTLYFIVEHPGTLEVPDKENMLSLSVYPNPASDVVTVNLFEPGKTVVRICSLSGEVLIEQDDQPQTDVSGLASGVYILTVSDGSTPRSMLLTKN